jgi:hypothetical protein
MKLVLVSIFACAIMLLNLVVAGAAQAGNYIAVPNLLALESPQPPQPDLLKQLETEIIPEVENILSPEQRQQLQSKVIDAGESFRKAFKSLTLTPEQKTELGNLFKSLPKKDIFASLSSDQKKQLFLKKKELFIPTPAEVSEKISAGMKKKEGFMPNFEAVGEKMSIGMKKMQEFKPTPDEIAKKISDKMSGMQAE